MLQVLGTGGVGARAWRSRGGGWAMGAFGETTAAAAREEETVVVGLLAQMIDWCRKREGTPFS